MMTRGLLLAGTALALVLAPAANAADSNKTQNRAPTNQELLDRIEKLEDQAKEKKEVDRKQDNRISPLEDTAREASWSFDRLRPRVRSADGRFELAFRGRVHFDVGSYIQDDNLPATVTVGRDLDTGAFVRRGRLAVEGRAYRDFWYELSMDFGSSGTEQSGVLQRARVAYMGIPNFRINIGILKPMMTGYDTQSSNEITFMERAGIINAVVDNFGGADRRRAIELQFQKEHALWQGDNIVISGAFTGQQTNAIEGTDEGTNVVGRVAWRLWSDGISNVQIGGSGGMVLNPHPAAAGGPRVIQPRDRPEFRSDATRLVDTGAISADGGSVYGFEAGANFKNFYVQGEWYKMMVDRQPAVGLAGRPEFGGWYVEGSWLITGEPKGYSASSTSNSVGVFGAPKVIKPFDLSGGSWGAWELAARYSVLDLDFNEGIPGAAIPVGGIRGGEQTVIGAGVNWYLNSNMRLMFNYLNVDVDRLNSAGAQSGQDFHVVAGRMQFAF